jgi:hypothetical protein
VIDKIYSKVRKGIRHVFVLVMPPHSSLWINLDLHSHSRHRAFLPHLPLSLPSHSLLLFGLVKGVESFLHLNLFPSGISFPFISGTGGHNVIRPSCSLTLAHVIPYMVLLPK